MSNLGKWLMALGLVMTAASVGGQLATWIPEDRRLWMVFVTTGWYLGGILVGLANNANRTKGEVSE